MSPKAFLSGLACWLYHASAPRLRPHGYLARLRQLQMQRSPDRQSPEEIWRRQKARFNALLATATEHVPYYRRLTEAGKMPRRIERPDDLGAVPVLTKQIIRREGKALLAENFPPPLLRHSSTGGSTGQPMEYWSDEETLIRGNAAECWALSLAGLTPTSSQAQLWGAARLEKNLQRNWREDFTRLINNRIFIDCFQMSPDDLRRADERLRDFRPQLLMGYCSALVELAGFVRREGITPNYPRRAVVSAAETLDDASRRSLEEVFGPNVFNRYGSREIGLVAMECDRHEGLHVDCENVLVELGEDPDLSGKGRIIVTKLHQQSMPFLRYDTEDLAEGTLESCPCGRGYPVLRRVVGRVTEMIRLKDGACLPGEMFPHLFKDCGIASYQVVQNADYSLRIALIQEPSQTPEQRQTLERVVRDHVRGLKVEIAYVNLIERTASGKLLPVRSHVARPTASLREGP